MGAAAAGRNAVSADRLKFLRLLVSYGSDMQSTVVINAELAYASTGGGLMILPEPDEKASPAETAAYIATLAKELRTLAAKADLGFLAFLLAMVADDADAAARELGEKRAEDA